MNKDEFKQQAESLADKYLLWKVNLPGPWTAVLTAVELAAYIVTAVVIYRLF